MAKRRRGFETTADMVRSLGVVGLFVVALLLLTVRSTPEPIRVDPAGEVAAAAQAGAFQPLAAAGLPASWRPTSARFAAADAESPGDLLHVGYLTPGGKYAAVDQSDQRARVAEYVIGADQGQATLAGRRWLRLQGQRDRTLVLTLADSTVVVYGSAGWRELELLAGALRPQP